MCTKAFELPGLSGVVINDHSGLFQAAASYEQGALQIWFWGLNNLSLPLTFQARSIKFLCVITACTPCERPL